MIKDILLHVSRSYNPYVSVSEIWGAGQTLSGELDGVFNARKFVPVDSGTNWEIITQTGNQTSLAIKTDGTMWAWGNNSQGQLGQNDTAPNRSSPTQIGTRTWVSASAANNYFIALTSGGNLWTWGSNIAGELGLGDISSRSSPTQIGTRTWKNIFGSGNSHTIALRSDDTIWAWGGGNGNFSEFGNFERAGTFGIIDNVSGPWGDVAVGRSYTLAIKTDGTMWAWGLNADGQLGVGNTVGRSSAVQVGTLNNWASVATGDSSGNPFTIAIKTDGTLWAWGANFNGQHGNNTVSISRSSPIQIGTLTNWASASAGQTHVLATKTDGTLWGWGGRNDTYFYRGQLAANAYELRQMDGLTTWVSASAVPEGHSLALKTDGTMWAWAVNASGQVGDGTSVTRSSPVQIGTLTWKKISASLANSYAIRNDDTIWSWGSNTASNLGINVAGGTRSSPVQIGTRTWKQISSGEEYAMAIRSDDTLWGWGNNSGGHIGDGTGATRSSPVQIGTLTWTDVACGRNHTIALRADGTLWSFGQNANNQLGLGDTISRSSPVQIGTRADWSKISAGRATSGAIRSDGTLWMWGKGDGGQIGNGTNNSYGSPVQIGTRTDWYKISLSKNSRDTNTQLDSNFAIRNDKTLWNWGQVYLLNQIDTGFASGGGQGYAQPFSSPVQIGSGIDWEDINASGLSNGFLTSNGAVVYAITTGNRMYTGPGVNPLYSIWGNTLRSSPVQIGTETNWSKPFASDNASAALKTDGTLWGWGAAIHGFPIINNSYISVDSPVQIGTDTWSKFSIQSTNTSRNPLAIKTDGTLWSWGNLFNPTNDPISLIRSSPVQVGTRLWNEVSAYGVVAIRDDGTLWSWGSGATTGQGDNTSRSSPTQVGNANDWYKVFGNSTHTAAIRTSWNYDLYTSGVALNFASAYERINGWVYPRKSPILVSQTNPWRMLSVGVGHAIGIQNDGTLWGWGFNSSGNLGLNDSVDRNSPVQIGARTDWANVKIFGNYTLALTTSGTLWAWGINTNGNLGLNDTITRSSPVQVGTRLWNDILASPGLASLAIANDGTLWTWGAVGIGLNNTNPTPRSSPVQVGTETNWLSLQNSQFTFSGSPAFARKTDKSLYVFAAGEAASAGVSFYKSSPVQVTSNREWKSVFAGNSFTIAISNSGSIWAWGTQTNGVIGNNIITAAGASQESPVQIGTLTNWVSGSAGDGHFVSIKTDGTLWSWGGNSSGQLGLTDIISRSSPVQIGTDTNWLYISAGRSHTMSIKSDGTLWGWGLNQAGQLGDPTLTTRSSPLQIGTRTWTKVSAGVIHSAAIRNDGTLWTWGNNTTGQLGQGNVTAFNSPVQVGTLTGWTDIAAGPSMTVAIRDGRLWVWGLNTSGQLGLLRDRSRPNFIVQDNTWVDAKIGATSAIVKRSDGTLWGWGTNTTGELGLGNAIDRSSPVQIGTSTWGNFLASANSNSFAIRSDGTLWGWGFNTGGQLGTFKFGPQYVITTNYWTKIDAGGQHSMAISTDGTLWGWGINSTGQLGVGDIITRSSPVQVGTRIWNEISTGGATNSAVYHTVGIRNDGTLWAWGRNDLGQLGLNLGSTAHRSSPVQVGTETNWSRVSTGAQHSMAIKTDGTLWAWGSNGAGELGLLLATSAHRSSPVQVGTRTWNFVSAGESYTMAIRSDGTLWSWGVNGSRQLGLGSIVADDFTNRSSPVQIGTDTNWSSVHAGWLHTFARKTNGTIWAWGGNSASRGGWTGLERNRSVPNYITKQISFRSINSGFDTQVGANNAFGISTSGNLYAWGTNDSGQLGDGTTVNRVSPVQIGTETNWLSVNGGRKHTAAIKSDGTLWTWGENSFGELGSSTTINRSSPVQIGTETNWSRVFSGENSTFGIKTNGTLWAWGSNAGFKLGLNLGSSTAHRSSPVQVGTLTDWSYVSGGRSNTMAVKTNGTLWVWGFNNVGQLGLLGADRSSPVQLGTETNWTKVSIGGSDSVVALKTDGTLWSWGRGDSGALGLGDTNVNRSSPVQIGTRLWTDIADHQGATFAFAIRNDGTLWAWGRNLEGQLGLGDAISRSSPVQVGTLNTWVSASAGFSNAVLLSSDSYISTTGLNAEGYFPSPVNQEVSFPVQIGPDGDWQSITVNQSPNASNGNGMAIKTDGTLWAWGNNAVGQRGDSNVNINRSSPVQVGTLNTWVSASLGARHSVLLLNDGTVFSTGIDAEGYEPFILHRSLPVQIGTDSNWLSIKSVVHSVSIKTDGTLWAWGRNTFGQLGEGAVGNNLVLSPVQVGTDTNWQSAEVGQSFTMAIRTNGTLWAWGDNSVGQLGLNLGSTAHRSSPVQVGTDTNWSSLANSNAGVSHTIAIKSNGTLWGWGLATTGQLGLAINTFIPNAAVTNQKFVDVKYGNQHGMAISTNGTLWGWGANNNFQLGLSDNTNRLSPVQVGTRTWNKVSPGASHTMAIRSDGTLWGWGTNSLGQLGLSDTTQRQSPVQVGTLTTWTEIASRGDSSVAIRNDGTLWIWGGNGVGQLGLNLGSASHRSSPVQVGTETNWSKIGNGVGFSNSYTMAIKSDGTLWAWGDNSWGQLGLSVSTNRSSPVQVGTETNWSGAAQSTNFTVGIKTDGTLYSWGIQGAQLGTENDFTTRSSPVQIGTRSWRSVFAGQDFAHAIRSDGTLWGWGTNFAGQLGNGDLVGIARSSPVQIGTLNTWTSGSSGASNASLLGSDGTLFTTGTGAGVAFDSNFNVTRSSPVQIGTDTNWVMATTAGSSTMAIKTNGTLWAWGNNAGALLGLGDVINRSSPVQVGTLTGWTSASLAQTFGVFLNNGYALTTGASNNAVIGFDFNVAVNRSSPIQVGVETNWRSVKTTIVNNPAVTDSTQTFAQKTDGTLWAWGNNSYGQLGDGTLIARSSPVQIGNETTWVDFDGELHFVGIKRY